MLLAIDYMRNCQRRAWIAISVSINVFSHVYRLRSRDKATPLSIGDIYVCHRRSKNRINDGVPLRFEQSRATVNVISNTSAFPMTIYVCCEKGLL